MKIKPDSLKERRDLGDAVTTPFDGLDLVVETLNESTGYPLVEVIQNVTPIASQRLDKSGIATNRTEPDLVAPGVKRLLCLRNRVGAIENGSQLLPKGVGLVEQGRISKKPSESLSFFSCQRSMILAQDPVHAFAILFVTFIAEFSFQALEFLFA